MERVSERFPSREVVVGKSKFPCFQSASWLQCVKGRLGGRRGDGSGNNRRDPEDGRYLQETCTAFPQTLRRQNRQGRASDWMQGGGREEPATTPEDLAGAAEHLVVLLIKLENRERSAGLEKTTSLVLDILGIISSKF